MYISPLSSVVFIEVGYFLYLRLDFFTYFGGILFCSVLFTEVHISIVMEMLCGSDNVFCRDGSIPKFQSIPILEIYVNR